MLLDSIVTVTGVPYRFTLLDAFPEGTRAIDYFPVTNGGTEGFGTGDGFFGTFGRSTRATICACETKQNPTLSQALHMEVGHTVRVRLAAGGVIKKLIESKSTPEDILEELFIRTLSRRPKTDEMTALRQLVGEQGKDPAVYEDILWSLLNATEFNFNH